jgi:hypothetical protein
VVLNNMWTTLWTGIKESRSQCHRALSKGDHRLKPDEMLASTWAYEKIQAVPTLAIS